MTSYSFKAVAADGKVRTGTLTAESEKIAAQELQRQGLIPVYVGAGAAKSNGIKLPSFEFGRKRDVLFFTQEMSTLLTAGVPLDRALSISGELTERPQFKPVILDILRVLKGGRTLADSLGTHPEYFPDIYLNMIRAGEASGSLAAIFERLSEYERTRDELRGYIISSMVYPTLLTIVGLSSIFILLYYVVPRFSAVFAESRMAIPTPTRILLETSALVRTYGAYFVGLLVAAIIGFRAYIGTPVGRYWFDGFKLKLPMIGDALRKAQTAQFARAMGTLVANNVPLVSSLNISRAIMTNKRMAEALELVAAGIKRGEGVAGPLARTGQFPPLASHLLSIGEETGHLDSMFIRMADIYEADTKASVKRFTALFEPLIILVLGVLVGVLILSMLLAITSINEIAA